MVLGIHPRLVAAIAAFDLRVPGNIWRAFGGDEDSRAALRRTDLGFLVPLAIGLATAVLLGARGVHHALDAWPRAMMAVFAGMLVASAPWAWRFIQTVTYRSWVLLALGAAATAWVSFLPATDFSTGPYAMILAGAIAVTAMLLPGISGSGLLLVLGAYATLIAAITSLDWRILLPFGLGAVAGLAVTSRVLRWLFRHRSDATFAVLTGLLLGSVVRVWPWRTEGGFAAGMPAVPAGDWASAGLIVLALAAGGAVVALQAWAAAKDR